MAVIAVGDFDTKEVEGIIRQKFSRIPAVKSPKPRTEYEIPSHKDTKVVIVTDPEQPNTVIQVIYKRPEIKEKSLNDLRESIKRGLFNTMLGKRAELSHSISDAARELGTQGITTSQRQREVNEAMPADGPSTARLTGDHGATPAPRRRWSSGPELRAWAPGRCRAARSS